jgi:hypothetical protein
MKQNLQLRITAVQKMATTGGAWTERAYATAMALALTALMIGVLGCAGNTQRLDPDSEDDALIGTIGSQDLRSISMQMAQSLVRIPQIQNASAPPTIAFTEVVNKSSEIMDTNDFLYKVRTELIKNSGGKMTFLDRDVVQQIMRERQAKSDGVVTGGEDKPLLGSDYFLAGRVESLDRSMGNARTTYMRLSFRLTDAQTSAIVWEDDYEVKKLRRAGLYDR